MNARTKRLVALAFAVALLAIAAGSAILTSSSNAAGPLTGSITRTYSANQCDSQVPPPPHTAPAPACWVCNGPVDLDSVAITVDSPVVTEAIRMTDGCTGRIGKITVYTQGGDGIKVTNGAHDIVVGSGFVVCGIPTMAGLDTTHNFDTDQYGIRAWGGSRITFAGMYVNCVSKTTAGNYASRFEYFVNQSPVWTPATDGNKPSKVLFVQGCLASGPQKTAVVGTSSDSGVATSTLYPFVPGPNHGPTYDMPAVPGGQGPPAVNGLDFGNSYPTPTPPQTCAGPNG